MSELLDRLLGARPRADEADRRRARFVTAIVLLLTLLFAALGLFKAFYVFTTNLRPPTLPLVWIAAGLLLGVYVYLRMAGSIAVGAWMTYAVTLIGPIAALVIDPTHVLAPAYLVVPAIVAAALLSGAQAIIALMVAGVAALAMSAFSSLQLLSLEFGSAALLVVLACGMLWAGMYNRQRVEADRQRRVRESERNFRQLAENADDAFIVVQRGFIVFANQRAVKLSGRAAEDLIGAPMLDHVHPDYRDLVRDRYERRLRGEDVPGRYEIQVLSAEDTAIDVEVNAGVTTWHGEPAELVAIRDIRERRLAEAQMRKLSSALQQTADAVMITDRNGVIEYVNPALELITGYSREEVLGKTPAIFKSGRQSRRFYTQLWDCIIHGEVFADVFINRRKDGSLYYEEKNITPLKNEQGRITHFIATGKDITERMRTQERLEYLAHHDSLTGLPNRVLFMDRIKQALARARWHHHKVALMFIDLDRFKGVNDSLGHDAGDDLLRELAVRLRHNVREGDTVARLGGDEFAVLLDDVDSVDHVSDVADHLLDAFREPLNLGNRELFITASMGISLFPSDGETVGTLLKHADVAMYKAKDLGKNTYQFYAADMSMRAFERLTLETSLRRALSRNEFEVFYQPQVDVQSGKVMGLEALLRWRHPDMGLVSPADFIALLEDTGLILPVGRWVLQEACKQARAWCEEFPEHWWLSVNVSGLQLAGEETFLTTVQQVLSESHLEPGRLELEITESVLMHDTDRALATMQGLNEHGVRLAIDDFGTGYSSLAYLKRFPLDTLKIDRTFVRDAPDDEDDHAIVASILALAHSLGLSVIAEGVETERQLDFLRGLGCEAVQGYLITPSLPASEVPQFIRRWQRQAQRA